MVNDLLYNPVFNALSTGDAALSYGTVDVKYFDSIVSPFIGIRSGYEKGFDELYEMLPAGRRILYATPAHIPEPEQWQLIEKVEGIQMVFRGDSCELSAGMQPVPLTREHVDAMISLAHLTRPGPFDKGTIFFGSYHGFFDGDQLIAMTGQRLHPHPYSEVSAVCTHPDYLRKGYAEALVRHQSRHILADDQIPFLHVRANNVRAISLYERIGYTFSQPMNFYFMRKEN